MFSHGTKARVWIDGFPASCYINEFSVDGEVDTAETTTLCDTRKTYIPGLEDATVSSSGFYDTNTLSPEDTLEALLWGLRRTVTSMTYFVQGGEFVGDPAYYLNGILTSYNIGTTVEDAATVEMEFQTTGGLLRGSVLVPNQTVTEDGTSSVLDNGADTSNGMTAVLNMSEITGSGPPQLEVTIEHTIDDGLGSPDEAEWQPLIVFDPQTAPGSQFVAVPGDVFQYLRVVWDIVGTGDPTATFNVVLGRN